MSRYQTACHAIAGAILGMTLAGCTTLEEKMATQVAAIPDAQRAYIVGSYRIECVPRKEKCHAAFNSITAHYGNLADPTIFGAWNVSEGGFGGNTVYDFVDPVAKEKGIYFCQSLPAGAYSLRSYSYWNYDGGGNGYRLREEDHFDVPFQAIAGEVVYLGDIKLTYGEGKNLLGMRLIIPGVVALSPGTPADAQRAVAKCAEAARALPMRSVPLQPPAGGHPLVIAKP